MHWHSMSVEDTVRKLGTDIKKGLLPEEVRERQKLYGKNIIEAKKGKNIFQKFLAQLADFMIIILIFAAALSLAVSYMEGKPNYIDPIIILMIIVLNAFLGVLQETRAEKALEALKKMSAPTAHVLREGRVSEIPSEELVPGDIVILETGSFVPADCRLIHTVNLKVEEASLTGESHPVEKNANVLLRSDTNIADRINMVMAASTVLYGRGTGVAVATGMDTQVGHIARMIMEDDTPDTPLQKRLARTGKALGIAALVICCLVFLIGLYKKLPPLEMFMTSVSLAVAAIPEGLPAIVTIMLSLGVSRMAKKNAVIRRLPAVETLGSATVICSDKTGTLTQNVMTVTEIASANNKEKLNSEFGFLLLSHAALCTDVLLQDENNSPVFYGEPTEKALVLAAYNIGADKRKLDAVYRRIYEIPFDSSRKLMTTVHKDADTSSCRSITKGAYDILIDRCTHIYRDKMQQPMTARDRNKIHALNLSMTDRALRVIAVAYKNIPSLNDIKNDALERNLTFLGLIGMIDPPREEAREAVRICRQAGIKPVMITGDHILTAKAIARELGILTPQTDAITGDELSRMPPDRLDSSISRISVFARVSPEHKVRIVKAFHNKGEVVAMTGDGVNDAPALKAADIGCAMGIAGTDVAKNASDMILTDDNFATIVSAVREGRAIYENIRKAIHFLLSCNIGEILTIFAAIIFGMPTPLAAVQLLWINLITDSLPAISLGVEPASKDIMKRKPIPPDKGMFADGLALQIIIEGILIGSLSLGAFVIGAKFYDMPGLFKSFIGHGGSTYYVPRVGRTMCFAVLSLSQLFHSFNMRSHLSLSQIGLFSNKKLVLSFLICTFLQMAVISIAPLAKIFQSVPLTLRQWAVVYMLAIAPIAVVELQKMSNNRHT